MCCTRFAGNAGPKKIAKKSSSAHHRTTLSAISSQLRHISTIGKKFVKQQYLLHVFSQYGELRPTSAEIVSLIWGTQANFNGVFLVLAALLHGTLVVGVRAKLCGVEQRAPPTFGRATISIVLEMWAKACLLYTSPSPRDS